MNPKIPKLREEHAKNKAKVSELQNRNRELEKQIRELENIDIVGMVRAKGFTLEQFAELLRQTGAPAPSASTDLDDYDYGADGEEAEEEYAVFEQADEDDPENGGYWPDSGGYGPDSEEDSGA